MNLQTFLSFDGRIPRKTFWLGHLVLFVAYTVLSILIFSLIGSFSSENLQNPSGHEVNTILLVVLWGPLILALVYGSFALTAKRWHDHGKSGWFVLWGFVPVANVWALVMNGFLRGTEGPNRFGPDPIAD